MTPPPIPLVRAHGTHAEAGRQVGEATSAAIGQLGERDERRPSPRRALPRGDVRAPSLGRRGAGRRGRRRGRRAARRSSRPRSRSSQLPQRRRAAATSSSPARGQPTVTCSSRTRTTSTPRTSTRSSPIEWRVPGQPVVFTLGIGPWISVGWNDAGLSMTGNELSPNDERVGIPRLLQVRDALTRRTLDGRGEPPSCTRPAPRPTTGSSPTGGRAAERRGVRDELRDDEPDADGILAHTNHYAREDMQQVRATPATYEARASRLERARGLGRTATAFTVEHAPRDPRRPRERARTPSAATATRPRT